MMIAANERYQSVRPIKIDVFSDNASTQQQELLYSLKKVLLEQHNIEVQENLIFWKRQNNWVAHINRSESDYIITLGQNSLEMVMFQSPNKPIIALMVNADTLDTLSSNPHGEIYAITHQQPLYRYFALIKALNIFQAKTGTFFSHVNRTKKAQYIKLADFYNLPFEQINVNPKYQGKDAVEHLANCCKILLHDRDSVYPNGKARKSILINSYRHRVVVLANAPTLLKEGAMLALFSQPYKIGEQAAKMLAQIDNKSLEHPYQYPDDFAIKINRRIAKLLLNQEISLGKIIENIETQEAIYKQRFEAATEHHLPVAQDISKLHDKSKH